MTLCCFDCGYVKPIPVVRLSAMRTAVVEHGVKCMVRLRDMERVVKPVKPVTDDRQKAIATVC